MSKAILAKHLESADSHAVAVLAEYGPGYFNPMIGSSRQETFSKIGDGLQLLHDLLKSEYDFEESRPGLALFAQTLWAAAQFEGNRPTMETGGNLSQDRGGA